MQSKNFRRRKLSLLLTLLLTDWASAAPVVVTDDFTGTTATNPWQTFGGACLTASTSTSTASGNIPGCVNNSYYTDIFRIKGGTMGGGQTGTLPDAAGNGALRLTAVGNDERGAIISNFDFAKDAGLSVVFKTVTYGGNGADGMSFFLMDSTATPALGGSGGSLAYSCSNVNDFYEGVPGAYIGLGMDEYGNFLNASDNTATGAGFSANRIGLRGAGNITWNNLKSIGIYPSNLSSNDQKLAVQNTCKTGTVWDYSKNNSKLQDTKATILDYPLIPGGYTNSASLWKNTALRPNATPITYNLKLTATGLLSLSYSVNGGNYQPVLTNQSISASNGPMPDRFKFGFTGATGGSNNIHEVLCFQAGPAEISTSSAGINTQQSGQVKTGTQIYLAYYHTNNWWGQLTSQNLLYSSANNGTVSISPTANWDASCVLTGGKCDATNVAAMTPQSPVKRVMLTWSGLAGTPSVGSPAVGIPFEWTSLSSSQQTALTSGDASATSDRLNFLRGDRTKELTTTGANMYRMRTSVLGDIIDSSPTWVGGPSAPYADVWVDSTQPRAAASALPENAASPYSSFVMANATRQNVVYVGADDGFLHGFRAGAYDTTGNFVNNSTSPNDGAEVLAYMPSSVLKTIHSTTATADYSNTQYAQAFSVDGTPYAGDLYYKNAWHTWLTGGIGPGGSDVWALDITNPSTTNFVEANASSLVMGDWSAGSFACVGDSGTPNCSSNLGQTFGTPQIRRFHNGMWGLVFGNGLNSTNGKAGIFIVTIDPTTAAQKVYYLDTGTTSNGITYVTPADLDGDHTVDYIYAGDVKGNVWRFDVTSTSPSNWAASKYGNAAATPLFTAASNQPITTKPLVAIVPTTTGASRVVVSFGTGQQVPQTLLSPATYASGSQALYGIWDWDMAAWNLLNPAAPKSATTGRKTIAQTDLTQQTVTATYPTTTTNGVSGYRTVSNTAVCWQGSTTCTSGNNQWGWELVLPTSSEQVIYSPILAQGAVIVNTTIPANNSALTCSINPNTGWTMAVDPATGGAFKQSFFGDASNNFVSYNGAKVSGIQIGAVGSPSVVTASNSPYLVNQTSAGTGHVDKIAPPGGTLGKRLTWQQLR
ncbi:MAG: pilus assembly protein PilY [Polaromonas sp.]|uniref:pilus assembly protein n=1 Tax=Polaromonas sp. TaxID=1869339 RepID=UPI0017C2A654|nr:PilC/PilY family type IV pilus protein [Polaromonas sp.]NMM09759.1 pilus assembly protein PilY [Polaromonas sp.]